MADFLDSLASLFGGSGNSAVDMSRTATNATVTGDELSATSHLLYGIQAKQAADFQAAQLRQNANSSVAAATRQAFFADEQTKLITSRALAVAASSGGGASDPTVIGIIARDAARGAYMKSVALYQGEDRARLMNEQADAKQYEGKMTEINSGMVAASYGYKAQADSALGKARTASLLDKNTPSLFSRFGAGGPMAGDDTYMAGIDGGAQ